MRNGSKQHWLGHGCGRLLLGGDLLLGGLGGGLLLGRLGLLLGGGGGLLGEQHGVDVGDHAAVGDGDAGEQPAELLVVADGEQQVARDDAGLLVVLGRVAGKLQDLRFEKTIRNEVSNPSNRRRTEQSRCSGRGKICAYLRGEVLEDCGEVNGGAGADALGVAALLEVTPDAADGELEPGLDGAGHRLLPVAALPSGHLACDFSGGEDSRGVVLAAVVLDRNALSL
uniref:Uncharacterized protein n=1 Tax=Aegilops tauschii subsp. strangulata TaxID=200361 RepID=A0A453MUN1_AEGTS